MKTETKLFKVTARIGTKTHWVPWLAATNEADAIQAWRSELEAEGVSIDGATFEAVQSGLDIMWTP